MTDFGRRKEAGVDTELGKQDDGQASEAAPPPLNVSEASRMKMENGYASTSRSLSRAWLQGKRR